MRVTIALYKREDTADGLGWRSVESGTRSGEVRLQIDEDALARLLGPRALRNRTRRAILADGAVVATVEDVREEPVT